MRILFLLVTIFGLLQAGGWNKKKHELFLKLSSSYLSANQLYLADGSLGDRFGTTKIFQNVLYAEYGISDSFTLIANVPFYNKLIRNNVQFPNNTFIEGAENSGVGDISLGLRYGLSQSGPVVWAIAGQIDLGTADAEDISGLYTGDAETNVQFALEMGHSFGNYKNYITALAGFNIRGEDTFNTPISNEVLLGFEIGRWFSQDFLAALKLRSVIASGTIENLSEFAQSEYTAFELEGFYKLTDKFGVTASYSGAFEVKNYFDSSVITVGLTLDLK